MILFLENNKLIRLFKKISTACYALRNIKYILPSDMQKLIYFALIHSMMSYSIILGSGSSYVNKVSIFQKHVLSIITDAREEFANNDIILTVYIFITLIYN
jgi:hypothetical protein